MKRDAGHDMDKKASDLIEAMKHHGVPPHCNSNGIISEGQAVGTYEQAFRLREDPDRKNTEEVDKVTKIR